jgi:hypothetical protein
MALRTGLYGTNSLTDVITMLPLFGRYGVSPAIYHFASARKHRIEALELFIFRLWLLMTYIRMLKDSGVESLGTTSTYSFQGSKPASEELLHACLAVGLHPLETPLSGLSDYYYPPSLTEALLSGQYFIMSKSNRDINELSPAAELRSSKVRNQSVMMRDIDLDMPNMIEEQVDYTPVACMTQAKMQLYRELYGAPVDFDEHVCRGIISVPNGSEYTARNVQLNLLNTLMIGGQPLYSWDKMFKMYHPPYRTNNIVNTSLIQEQEAKQLAYYQYTLDKQATYASMFELMLHRENRKYVLKGMKDLIHARRDVIQKEWPSIDLGTKDLGDILDAFINLLHFDTKARNETVFGV